MRKVSLRVGSSAAPLSGERREQFEKFYREHYGLAVGYLRRFVADADDIHDIVTHSFELALSRFDEYIEKQMPRYWFFGIVRNSAGYFTRRRFRPLDRFVQTLRRSESPEEILLRKEESASMDAIMGSLPEKYREVVWLRMADCSYKDIATTLGITVAAVESRMRRALHMLEPLFAQYLKENK